MGRELTRDDIRESLVRHDPLGAWDPQLRGQSDYTDEAVTALADMTRIQGIAHIITIVADALDRSHPGFYVAYRRGETEAVASMRRVGRELWDIHGITIPGKLRGVSVAHRDPDEAPLPSAPPIRAIAGNPQLLMDWLRSAEAALRNVPSSESSRRSPVGTLLQRELPVLVDGYAEADATTREAIRDAFSRFPLARYQLSAFAGSQYSEIVNSEGEPITALRRALSAESVLDMGLDWRDELLMLRDLKSASEARGLPFATEVEKAAQRSSTATARFLRGVAS